jgi:GTP:adenosylcobinamide-phosphate guanylyltransferase
MDAIVTAGGIPTPDEALYAYTQGESKALIEIAGKPMIQWVFDALSGAETIENVVVVGLENGDGLTCEKPVYYIPNQGGMIANAQAGARKVLELNPQTEYVMAVSSDIPTITSKMINWAVQEAMQTRGDIYYFVVSRETMEARFPGSNRSFYPLKDLAVCGADMHISTVHTLLDEEGLFVRISEARKNAFKQARIIGLSTLFHFLFRTKTLDELAVHILKRLHLTGRAVLSPYAEMAMDVDKPHQLEQLRADLESKVAA